MLLKAQKEYTLNIFSGFEFERETFFYSYLKLIEGFLGSVLNLICNEGKDLMVVRIVRFSRQQKISSNS
jgi:hypothetical protein